MKLKCLIAVLLCFVLLFCTACSINFINFEPISGTAPSGTKAVTAEVTTAAEKESAQALYKKYLTDQFKNYIKSGKGTWFRTPPQFRIADQHYAFYDVDSDGLDELIWLIDSVDDSYLYSVYGIYTIRSGTVMNINIKGYKPGGYTFYPEVMSDGSLRAEVGFGHVPGYAYMHLINGDYELTDLITPPCGTRYLTQYDYEYTHYADEYYTSGYSKENKTKETITSQEFDRRIAQLNSTVTPAKLEVKSLLAFGQENDLSINWLEASTDSVTSFVSPVDAPLTRRSDLKEIFNNRFAAIQKDYKTSLNMFNKPDSVFFRQKPPNCYYAFYDLDGNGDNELFFGEENENGKILITRMYSENGTIHVSDFVSLTPQNTYLLSNGRMVAEYTLPEGNIPGKLTRYFGISLKQTSSNKNNLNYQYLALWSYGDEAAFYNYSNMTDTLPLSLTPEAYKQQKALLEGDSHVIGLDWKPLMSYEPD